jgi:flagellin
MALGINTNVASLSAQNQLQKSQNLSNQALERLSSGLRINSAKDDAAGLAISTRFSAQISGLSVAQRNANDGISYAQTAEGALGEITNALSRIRDLAVQSANDTNSASDREALNQEAQALIAEVNRITDTTQFNNQNVIDGSLAELQFQVGANAGQVIKVSGVDTRGSQLGSIELDALDSISRTDLAAMTGGDGLKVNDKTVSMTGVTSSEDLVEQINALSKDTGVTASLGDETVADLGAIATAFVANDTITINDGTAITLAGGETVTDLRDLINEQSSTSGVVASVEGSNLVLTSDGAESIKVDLTGTGAFDEIAAAGDETYDAGIQLSSSVTDAINITSDTTSQVDAVFGANGDVGETRNLDGVDITERDLASQAINTIDSALDQVNSLRAELGAVQSRFESTISNLASSSENLSAANSRILDADFAAETAKLSKAQVLQQAGISVLAQANARPQQVLSLLQ